MRNRLHTLTFLAAALLCLGTATLVNNPKAEAVSGGDFVAGDIISDGIFFNRTSMSAVQVQSFLNSKVPNCDTNGSQIYSGSTTRAQYSVSKGYPGPYTCLKDYSQNTPSMPAENGLCNAYSGGYRTAAQIITDIGVACGVNPQVLLVLLQKEQSLVTDTWPWSLQYTKATGFACPDTAPCDSSYGGFYYQVYYAARQFKKYARDSGSFNYRALRNNNILFNPNAACGSSSVYVANQATAGLYNYTPYQPNAAALNNLYGTGDGCSAYGNRNFWRMFSDWFGNTRLPTVFTTAGSPAVYVQATGYKFYVPSISMLQDYGLGVGAQQIPQSSADSIPLASSANGMSSTLGNVVKSSSGGDSGNIYLITNGNRYVVRTMQQLADFGYNESHITYLPPDFISLVPLRGVLNNYVQTSETYSYYLSGGTRRLIPEGPTYLNNHALGAPSIINANMIASMAAGMPLSDSETLFRFTDGPMYLFKNNAYYYVPSSGVLDCWGFNSALRTQYFPLGNNGMVAPVTNTADLDCKVRSGSTTYFLNGSERIAASSASGITGGLTNADLVSLSGRLPVRAKQLGTAIQASNNSVVWYVEGGTKRGIPSLLDLQLLNISASTIDYLSPGIVNQIPEAGIKFGVGQVVKESDGNNIYLISGNTTKRWITTGDDFSAYSYGWSNLPTFTKAVINNNYTDAPEPLKKYLYTDGGGVYLMDPNGCYGLDTSQVTAYGRPTTAVAAGQDYASTIFPYLNLARCSHASVYVKSPNQSAIYLIENGNKRLVSTWAALTTHSQSSNPRIIHVSNSTLDSFANGSVL